MAEWDYERMLTDMIESILERPQSQERLNAGRAVRVWDNSVPGISDVWCEYSERVIMQYRARGWRVVDDPTMQFSWLFYREAGK